MPLVTYHGIWSHSPPFTLLTLFNSCWPSSFPQCSLFNFLFLYRTKLFPLGLLTGVQREVLYRSMDTLQVTVLLKKKKTITSLFSSAIINFMKSSGKDGTLWAPFCSMTNCWQAQTCTLVWVITDAVSSKFPKPCHAQKSKGDENFWMLYVYMFQLHLIIRN